MGRPSKLTPEVQKRLCDAIRAGNYYEAACAYAGIDYSTFRRWMKKGEGQKRGKYREFCEAVTRAELEAEARLVAQWQQHMPNDYRAIRDFLERRFPERWGRREKIDANVTHNGQVKERHEYDITYRIEQYANEYEQIYEELAKRESALKSPDEGDDTGE